MKSCDHGYVTVEHAIGFLAVTAVIGVIVAVAQAGLTGASLCQAVRVPRRSGRVTRRRRPRPRTPPAPTRLRAPAGG